MPQNERRRSVPAPSTVPKASNQAVRRRASGVLAALACATTSRRNSQGTPSPSPDSQLWFDLDATPHRRLKAAFANRVAFNKARQAIQAHQAEHPDENVGRWFQAKVLVTSLMTYHNRRVKLLREFREVIRQAVIQFVRPMMQEIARERQERQKQLEANPIEVLKDLASKFTDLVKGEMLTTADTNVKRILDDLRRMGAEMACLVNQTTGAAQGFEDSKTVFASLRQRLQQRLHELMRTQDCHFASMRAFQNAIEDMHKCMERIEESIENSADPCSPTTVAKRSATKNLSDLRSKLEEASSAKASSSSITAQSLEPRDEGPRDEGGLIQQEGSVAALPNQPESVEDWSSERGLSKNSQQPPSNDASPSATTGTEISIASSNSLHRRTSEHKRTISAWSDIDSSEQQPCFTLVDDHPALVRKPSQDKHRSDSAEEFEETQAGNKLKPLGAGQKTARRRNLLPAVGKQANSSGRSHYVDDEEPSVRARSHRPRAIAQASDPGHVVYDGLLSEVASPDPSPAPRSMSAMSMQSPSPRCMSAMSMQSTLPSRMPSPPLSNAPARRSSSSSRRPKDKYLNDLEWNYCLETQRWVPQRKQEPRATPRSHHPVIGLSGNTGAAGRSGQGLSGNTGAAGRCWNLLQREGLLEMNRHGLVSQSAALTLGAVPTVKPSIPGGGASCLRQKAW
eukprot:TRINITY_DN6799_c0_g1_i1.p1 TRINITY_DN6799_c0_g1~~TRINITY_DN6799_c0_g1_i1.p1  ORF type:complete len:682 (-),score=110.66 TRINITY_DN6799_c0_g1_i1:246-2291(-)